MKRKTLLFSLILAMVIISLALCGSDTPDGNLSMDEDDFVELVVDAPLSLHYLESVYSLKAVNQIVGNEGEDGFAEVLYNANDEAEYVLATAEEGGYAIFHRMTGALMEAGEFGTSPYAGQSGKKYYFGPSNYAVKDVNDVTTDIMRGVMTTEQISAMHQYMAEKRALVVDRSETKSYANMLSALQTANTAEQQGDVSLMNVVDDWGINPFKSQVNVNAFVEVEHSNFYKRMTRHEHFGHNTHGSCIFVSTVLLLRYYDMFYAPGILPNETIPEEWITFCSRSDIPEIPHYKDATEDDYSCVINSGDSVYDALHKYLIALEFQGRTTTSDNPAEFGYDGYHVDEYNLTLPTCTEVENELIWFTSDIENQVFLEVKSAIDTDNPIAMAINYEQDGEEECHMIVAYGYYQGTNQNYYKVHFGWSNASAIIVPSYFANGELNIISVEDSHTNTYSKCGFSVCESKLTDSPMTCFANNGHPKFSENGLAHKCYFCNDIDSHSGRGLMDSWTDYNQGIDIFADAQIANVYQYDNDLFLYDNDYHFCACEECLEFYMLKEFNELSTDWLLQFMSIYWFHNNWGQWDYMKAYHNRDIITAANGKCMATCSDCGYIREIDHVGNFTYRAKVDYHIVTCGNCGGSYQAPHKYMFGSNRCPDCGIILLDGGGLLGV